MTENLTHFSVKVKKLLKRSHRHEWINLTAPFLLSRTASLRMRERGWGRIINMASVAGRTRSMVSGAHYSASKAGLIGFSRMFASQVAKDGITVNCIAPGTIDAGLDGQLDAHMTANHKKNIANISTVAPHFATGRIKGLATTGLERFPLLSDLPDASESGIKDLPCVTT
ncbi:hypothetical protein CR155_20445 [Pollutimonas nitritireducens]|uniref:Uncharacterized protein n=1 Tax=Pollutimonas nitritireducens TaxID=2045209 RepID=A0A2N4UAG3_9BURK|nr:SDR family NAD(P)-dependent oxidoreductase [Pollutimonas nitritireducens]PLC51998.1 hypothetical protein CR155_20445 [Pollutimonas nitritireducens]